MSLDLFFSFSFLGYLLVYIFLKASIFFSTAIIFPNFNKTLIQKHALTLFHISCIQVFFFCRIND